MKKIVLMMMVAMVPFLTMAQKKSKKSKRNQVETVSTENSKATVEYMVIKGVEMPMNIEGVDEDERNARGEDEREIQIKRMLKPQVKLIVIFDFGNIRNKEVSDMIRTASSYRSMAAAANAAAEKGWEFVSANVLSGTGNTTHYYYMKRNK